MNTTYSSTGNTMQYRIERHPDGEFMIADVKKRGNAVLADPLLNKGTAFSENERRELGLMGMLPHQVTDRERQVRRAFDHIHRKGSENPLEKYIGMAGLQDRNETLFYQVLEDHITELLPIVYTPTVGEAALGYSHIFRRGRGLWITPEHSGRIDEVLGHARNDEVHLIVATDNERILGLGDQGAGGMVIPIGKLALYTLAAGVHPAYTLPISLDVGTDNQALLDDELYVGWPGRRLRGKPYDDFVDEFVSAVRNRFPNALLQWEDFKKTNALRLLDRYRTVLPSFNDDVQGTGAVVVAGLLAMCRATQSKLSDHRFMLVGAGAAGIGIARQLRHALVAGGLTGGDPIAAVSLVDTGGLVTANREGLEVFKSPFALPLELVPGAVGSNLADLVSALRPTVLIGTSGQPGLFDEAVVTAMAAHCEVPVLMALSNPTSKCEALAADLVEWTDGRAIVASGSPSLPVAYRGRSIPVSQCNNVYIFPGVGLGAIVSGACRVTDEMFGVAAETLAAIVTDDALAGGMIFPPLADLRSVTRRIAEAVAHEAIRSGVSSGIQHADVQARLDLETWNLEYPGLVPAG